LAGWETDQPAIWAGGKRDDSETFWDWS